VDKTRNYTKGKNGEEIAKKYLEEAGMETIEMNFENKLGEVDLIVKDKEWLVFVEVKLKVGDRYGTPEEMINKRKLSQVKRVAESFLVMKPQFKKQFEKYRIDAVAIVLKEDKTIKRIRHYKNLYG
jgi:putative endonuclease